MIRYCFILIPLIGLGLLSAAQDQRQYLKEGNAAFRKDQLAEAISHYDKVTDKPLHYTALINKATALYRLKKFEDALKVYGQVSRAAQAGPALQSGAYYNAGVVHSNQSNVEASITAYKQALRLNPGDHQARENLQKALLERKKGGGGGGGPDKPRPSPASKLSQAEAQRQLKRLEQKEKNTQSKVADKKTQYGGSVGKDW